MAVAARTLNAPALLLVLTTAVILYAGLAPFEFNPVNGARFDPTGPGLSFDGRGFAVSRHALIWREDEGEVTVEIRLRVADTDPQSERTILTLDDREEARPFELIQDGRDLVVRDRVVNPDGDRWSQESRFADVLAPGVVQHIVVTSSEHGPRLFVDARPAVRSGGYDIATMRVGEPFGGHLFLGATSGADDPWIGEVLGLAIYRRAFAAHETAEPALGGPGPAALYPFDDGGGNTARNLVDAENPLELPRRFLPWRRKALHAPRPDDWIETWYLADAVRNVAGFIPWGFAAALVLRGSVGVRRRRTVCFAVLIGAILSLSIEFAQHYANARDSSLTDFVLNSLGAWVGAVLGGGRDRDRRERMDPTPE